MQNNLFFKGFKCDGVEGEDVVQLLKEALGKDISIPLALFFISFLFYLPFT